MTFMVRRLGGWGKVGLIRGLGRAGFCFIMGLLVEGLHAVEWSSLCIR